MTMFVSALPEVFPDLPEEFISLLPLDCDECESPLLITEVLTSLQCSNPRCPVKLRMRIKAICSDLDIKEFGESRIKAFLDKWGTTNPMDIFDLQYGMPLGEGIGDQVAENVITNIINVRENREFLLWEAVKIQNLPGIQTSAQAVFTGFSNIRDAYEVIEDGGAEFISSRIVNTPVEGEIGIRALNIYKTLMEFKDDVIEGVEYLKLTSMEGKYELNVVVSDEVGSGFKTKNEFYNYCKQTYNDRFHFNFLSSLTKKADFLIWAGADGSPARYTSKVDKAERYNDQGAGIPIMTAGQFIEFVESGQPVEDAYSVSIKANAGTHSDDLLYEDVMAGSDSGGLL